MTVATSLIPGLDEIIRNGDPKRRAEAARRIAELFCRGPRSLRPDHVELFDGILIDLVPHTEIPARADLAERLSRAWQCATRAGRATRARGRNIDRGSAAAPIARDRRAGADRNRAHQGPGPSAGDVGAADAFPDLTDVIVRRGDREVVRRAAGNAGAQFSHAGYSALIKRAGQDGVLTLTVGQRDDLSGPQLKDLLAGSIDVVRRRLFDVVKPGRQAAIKQAMGEISGIAEARREPARLRAGAAHDPRAAQRR